MLKLCSNGEQSLTTATGFERAIDRTDDKTNDERRRRHRDEHRPHREAKPRKAHRLAVDVKERVDVQKREV